ncbi:peptidyl-prolyl cis-trans isomerase E-like [Prionailurus viverrinus]|uniref:peptidyl-prolyl cis-trans isomerase E-like n=1 Tax=Prionailurus viverrinus TaxID=61388 RepID=UPI001FF205FE|nr:peptidyl-prolyl cis-trans isomerase E-like [Prionailurus viverrinus]XP_047725327.1 peptidyl-prolyl cis-trans isomerase E-like [Prionailurus viverrinus]XP_047725328.1 peptidyl-prolyl cis-trans isomerase E-like [Prionailurus viverrinus]XP_047725329.1 peptidyl-prolyl cis-trans isomerase E-like [Prionailurus viverrinus]XP_047725331.1 peptidyl-prolyl cis-trans isomerase E-like [Prionailurus viverrinus]
MAADKTVLFVAELAWVSLVALPPQPVSSARDLTAVLVLALPRALSLYDLGLGELGDPAAKKASSNPQVYMDIKIGNKPAGCIQMLLRSDIVPITAGLLSMVSSGPNTNSSRFVLTCDKTDWVDGKHIVFGEVTEGLDVLQQIEMGAHLGPGSKCLLKASW